MTIKNVFLKQVDYKWHNNSHIHSIKTNNNNYVHRINLHNL